MKIRALIDGKVVFGWYVQIDGRSLNKKLGIRHYVIPESAYIYRDPENEPFIAGIIQIDPVTAAVCTGKQDKTDKDIYGSKGDMLGGDRVHVHGNNKATVEWQTHQQTWGIWGQCLCGYSSGDLEIIPQEK